MSSAARLRALVTRLRADCPWDRAQDLRSMRPYLLEECHEVLGALDSGDLGALREELGDLLFQVAFLARLAEEAGAFDLDAVTDGVVEKMVERHPHVYAREDGAPASDAEGSVAAWEARKAARRGGSRVDGVPATLPALLRAHRVGEKVARFGFDWPDRDGVLAKIDEERDELRAALASGDDDAIRHEYGDLLLACANLGRWLGIPGEDALREANARFERRFRGVEAEAQAAAVPLEEAGAARLEAWWQTVKAREAP
jgi:ATP diphosphatase